jgi:hypothetical protein
MLNRQENGLKGQHNLAQGKRSGALGWKADRKFVRAITFIKEKILFRTSAMTKCFLKMMSVNSQSADGRRPKGIICIVHRILTDGFYSASFTQGGVSVRSSRNYALG